MSGVTCSDICKNPYRQRSLQRKKHTRGLRVPEWRPRASIRLEWRRTNSTAVAASQAELEQVAGQLKAPRKLSR